MPKYYRQMSLLRQLMTSVLGMMLALSTVASESETRSHLGLCDASAAIQLDEHHFVVAEDEKDLLALYRWDQPGNQPLKYIDFNRFLDKKKAQENDIEAAAKQGDVAYWITSHGRNAKGKQKASRARLFASYHDQNNLGHIQWLGSYSGLLADLVNKNQWLDLDDEQTKTVFLALKKAIDLERKKNKQLAPKHSGLNIEGLAVGKKPGQLLIGLRNPVVDGQAIVIVLDNADDLVNDNAVAAVFSQAYLLPLAGRGVRGMVFNPNEKVYYLIAGPRSSSRWVDAKRVPLVGKATDPLDSEAEFILYRWDLTGQLERVKDLTLGKGQNPESLVYYPKRARLQIIYDEGSRLQSNGLNCKKSQHQRFSYQWLVLH